MARRKKNEIHDVKPKTGATIGDEFQIRKNQLEDIQARAHDDGDLRAELAAIQELNKLCGLYSEPVENGESASAEIARLHLEGTGVVEKGLPLEELARRVAAILASNLDALKVADE